MRWGVKVKETVIFVGGEGSKEKALAKLCGIEMETVRWRGEVSTNQALGSDEDTWARRERLHTDQRM